MKSTVYIFSLVFVCMATACHGQIDYSGRLNETQVPDLFGREPSAKEKQQRWKDKFAYVTKVVDGDTFWVDNGTEKFKVRFIGIDAPETRDVGRKKKGYYGEEAKEYVHKLTEYKWVRLETDVQSHDRYKRLLAYIYLEDGTFLNADLVAKGYAIVSTFPPNVKYVDLFVELQGKARNKKIGLWDGDITE